MKTLLHICCAPCSIKCIESLRNEGIEPTGFWHNTNIHPFKEYESRRDTAKIFAQSINLNLIVNDEYGLRTFISNVYPNFNNRCETCYRMRLEKTAQYAAENGYDNFLTTLLISPYQNHELLCKVGQELAEKYNINFLKRDFRPLFREGQKKTKDLNLYMQKYCGCVFSEEDRYKSGT